MPIVKAHISPDESREALQQFNEEWRHFEAGDSSSGLASILVTPGNRRQTILKLIEVFEQARQLVAALRDAGATPGRGSESQPGLETLKELVETAGDLLVGAQQGLQTVRQKLNRLKP
jgi:hypothetical protein